MVNYLSYFSPQFLATSGAGEATYGMLPGFGVLGIIVTMGLILALIRPNKKVLWLIICTLIAAIPASLSKGSYPANRLLIMLPFIIILSAFGLYSFFSKKSLFLKIVISILFLTEIGNFFIHYFYSANTILAKDMLYGHQQAVAYTQLYPESKVIYSRKLSEPQAYVAFFTRMDPLIFQKYAPTWLRYQSENKLFVDQLGEYQLDRYTFKEISFSEDAKLPHTILIGRPEEFPGITPNKVIYYPSASKMTPAIYIYQTHD